jgi:hypothetical protein
MKKTTTTTTKKYEDYSFHAKYFASIKTVKELEAEIKKCTKLHEKYTKQNLALAKKSSVILGNNSKNSELLKSIIDNNNAAHNYRQAIEIHTLFPNEAKK